MKRQLKKLKSIWKNLIVTVLIAICFNTTALAYSWLGSGTVNDPYQIATVSHLNELATLVNSGSASSFINKYFKLMNDIDFAGYPNFTPIGNSDAENKRFLGRFDGDGKVIRNLSISSASNFVGLFGVVGGPYNIWNVTAIIENLGIENCYVAGNQYVGGLVGKTMGSTSPLSLVYIDNCYVTGTIIGSDYVGGLIGSAEYGATVRKNYTTANVTGNQYVGGIIGITKISSILLYCYATGDIVGTNYVGGLAGAHNTSTSSTKSCVAANSSVTATSNTTNVNRICGTNNGSFAKNYALNTMILMKDGNPFTVSDALNGAAGMSKPIEILQSETFYTTSSNWDNGNGYAGNWDFTEIWKICVPPTFPIFQYQNCPPPPFVPVTEITDLPTTAVVNVPLTLTATVLPTDATNQTIVWTVVSGSATITSGNVLTATAVGNVIIKATIEDGEAIGLPYWREFQIVVTAAFVPVTDITNVPSEATVNVPLILTATVLPSNATNQTIVWSVISGSATINGNQFLATNTGTVTIRATIQNGSSPTTNFTKDFNINVTSDFVPVTDITNVPKAAIVNTPLTLTATVLPTNATNKTIVWSVVSGSATISGNVLTATAVGTVTVKATIKNGSSPTTDYTQNFDITVTATFVAVTNISNVPTTATVNVPLTLTATVTPSNATNQTIVWTVKSAGTTNAKITNGNQFTATAVGTATVTATIKDGKAVGTDYTKDFSIKVEGGVAIDETAADNEPSLRIYPNPTNGELHIGYAMCDNAICDIEIYDLMGRRVNNCQLSTVNCQLKIDVSHLPPGMYFLKIGEKTAKFVKE